MLRTFFTKPIIGTLGVQILRSLDWFVPTNFKEDKSRLEYIRARLLVAGSFFVLLIIPNLIKQISFGAPLTDARVLGPVLFLVFMLSTPFVLLMTRSLTVASSILPILGVTVAPYIMANSNGLASHPAFMTTLITGAICFFSGLRIGFVFFLIFSLEILTFAWGHFHGYFGGIRDLDIIAIANNIIFANFGTLLMFRVFIAIHQEMQNALQDRIIELNSAHLKLMKSAKMASLGEMAGGVAHEINNPLAIISGYVQQLAALAKRGNLTPDKAESISKKTLATIDRIHGVVEGMRKLSRGAPIDDVKTVDLNTITDEAIALCKEKLRPRGGLIENNIPTGIQVHCQHIQVCQVIVNLLNNSLYAIEGKDRQWIRLDAIDLGESVHIIVTDSGKGVNPLLHDKLFDPFFTTKPAGDGTGLGLSISRQIMRNHGGDLFLGPQTTNTQFIIQLPKKLNTQVSRSPQNQKDLPTPL